MSAGIPYLLHQTVAQPDTVPAKVQRNVQQYAGSFRRRVYSDQDCRRFLQQHFPEYVSVFDQLRGAHKADLFRYAVLYVHGGVYMDIKLELVRPLDAIVDMTRHAITTNLSGNPHPPPRYAHILFQSMIAAPAGQPLFLNLMAFIAAHVQQAQQAQHYLLFTRDMYDQILADTASTELVEGEHASLRDPRLSYILLQEVCSKDAKSCPRRLDRYGFCCQVRSQGRTQFMSRYHDYPWGN